MTKLERLKSLEWSRARGPWHVGHIDENLDRGEIVNRDGFIIASDVARSCEGFICELGNNASALIELWEVAQFIEDNLGHWILNPEGPRELKAAMADMRAALQKLEAE